MRPDSVWEVYRSLKLTSISHQADAMAVETALAKATGVIKSKVDLRKKRLWVLYNRTITNFTKISDILEDTGFPPDGGWWQGIKANWYEYLDENAKTNARAPAPPCCNKPPK